jgi:hypothetical protein
MSLIEDLSGLLFAFDLLLRAMKKTLIVLPIALLLPFAACNKAPEPLTAEDLRIARAAIPTSEVLSMLRAGYKEPEIIKEVKRRRIPGKIDGPTEDQFIKSGASATLIATLKNEENTLTENQRGAFEEHHAEKTNRMAQLAETRQSEAFARQQEEQQEINRRRYLQQQTMRNINRSQSAQVSYEVAQRNYEAQRKSLEQRITALQAQINHQRTHGYTEAQLAAANQTLDDYNKQLRDLTPPLR